MAYNSIVLSDESQYGTNAHVNLADNLPAFSISCWVNFDDANNSYAAFFLKGYADNTTGLGWALLYNPPGNGFFGTIAGTTTTAQSVDFASFGDNTWHNIIMTWDGTTIFLYLDGNDVTNSQATGPVGNYSNTSTTLSVSDFYQDGVPYVGKMADVRVWNTTISAGDAATIFAGGAVPAGLICEWQMTEGSGVTLADHTGNGNTETFTSVGWSTDIPSQLPPLTNPVVATSMGLIF